MAVTIIYKLECHCGGDATARVLNLDNPQPDGTIDSSCSKPSDDDET